MSRIAAGIAIRIAIHCLRTVFGAAAGAGFGVGGVAAAETISNERLNHRKRSFNAGKYILYYSTWG